MRISVNQQFQNQYAARGFEVVEVSGLADFEKLVRTSDHSPGIFRDGHRSNDNWNESDCLYMDVDGGLSISDFQKHPDFVDVEYFLVTSRNHKKAKDGVTCDRFHVFFPVSTITDRATLERTLDTMAGKDSPTRYPFADHAATDPARFFFASREAEVIHHPGSPYSGPTFSRGASELHEWGNTGQEQRDHQKATAEPMRDLSPVVSGRNNTLASVSGSMRRKGFGHDEILEALLALNRSFSKPLDRWEVEKTARSVSRYEPAQNQEGGEPDRKWVRIGDVPLGPTEWLIRGVLETTARIIVFGASGGGKTFLVLDWACCIATGRPWAGHSIKKQGHVAYICGEGMAGIRRRIRAWEIANNTLVEDFFIHGSVDLMDGATNLIKSMKMEGITPALVIIDTLNQNATANENSAEDAAIVGRAQEDMKAAFPGTSILIVTHTGVSPEAQDRQRGSSAWKAGVDQHYQFDNMKVDPEFEGRLICRKMKDGEPPTILWFDRTIVDLGYVDEDGQPTTSCVLVPRGQEDRATPKPKPLKKYAQALHEMLYQMPGIDTGNMSFWAAEWTPWDTILGEWALAGSARPKVYEALKELEKLGLVEVQSTWKGEKRIYEFIRVPRHEPVPELSQDSPET